MDFNSLNWASIFSIAFLVVAIIQVFYYLFFFHRLIRFKQVDANAPAAPVSVIICARDEEKNLVANLPVILKQSTSAEHEILVVNDNSLDETKYILQEFRRNYDHLEVLELSQESKGAGGKKVPLSIGIKSAKHELLLLTDADCKPLSDKWVDSMAGCYEQDTEIVLGYGAFEKRDGTLNKLIRWETAHSAIQYLSFAMAGIPYMGVGRNLSYRKHLFFKHKGFAAHNHLPGGDDDLFINQAATSKNTRVNIDKNSFTISRPADSWKQWRHQKNRHYTTSRMYKPLHKFLLALYSFSQFLFYPIFLMALFFNWQLALPVLIIKTAVMIFVFSKSLRLLNEDDLSSQVILLDLWMFVYYIMFAGAVFRKPAKQWK